jgi:hypothetical protein
MMWLPFEPPMRRFDSMTADFDELDPRTSPCRTASTQGPPALMVIEALRVSVSPLDLVASMPMTRPLAAPPSVRMRVTFECR